MDVAEKPLNRGPHRPNAPDDRRDRGNLQQPRTTAAGSEQALRRLRLPAEVSRPRRRTRQFEPAQRDVRQGAGKIPFEWNFIDNAAVVRLSPATSQAQQTRRREVQKNSQPRQSDIQE